MTAQPGKVILCVDERDLTLSLNKLLLELAGYAVLSANTVQQATRILQSHNIGLVILDNALMGRPGSELASDFKRLRPGIPVLMLSSGLPEEPDDLVDVDAFLSILEKPPVILERVAELLAGRGRPNHRRLSRFSTRKSE